MKKLCLIGAFLGLTAQILARPLRMEDVHTKSIVQVKGRVKADLSYASEATYCTTLLDDSEQARENATMIYSIDRSHMVLSEPIAAWTEIEGRKIPVDSANIKKGSGYSSNTAFEDLESYTISFPQAVAGARLCYSVKETSKPVLADYFEGAFEFPYRFVGRDSIFIIESELPLYVYLSDVMSRWDFQEGKSDSHTYTYTVKPRADYLNGWMFEDNSDQRSVQSPLLILRNHTSYTSSPFLGLRDKIEQKIAAATLSPELKETLRLLQEKTLGDEKKLIQEVIALANSRVRYMADFRTNEGKFIPRSLEEIIATGYGDCKDFSLFTVKMLRHLGIETYFALIKRGNIGTISLAQSFWSAINHAVVHVKSNEGFFVDPTNKVSCAFALEDILDRQGLVLGRELFVANTPTYRESPDGCDLTITKTIDGSVMHTDVGATIKGLRAANFLCAFLHHSPEVIQRALINAYTPYFIDYRFQQVSELKNRCLTDYSFSFSCEEPLNLIRTPLGTIIDLSEPFEELFSAKIEERCTGFAISPSRNKKKIFYPGHHAAHPVADLSVAIRSPWLEFTRVISDTAEGIRIVEEYQTLRDTVTPQEVLSEEFARLHQEYHHKVRKAGLVLKRQQVEKL